MAAPGLVANKLDNLSPPAFISAGARESRGCTPSRLLPAALAGADRLQAAPLALVQGQVAADGDRGCDDDDRNCGPRWQNGQEDQPENDPGDPDLHARCHDDSIHPGYPTQPRPA